MNRIFRKKKMRMIAALLSVAVLAGSMDVNLLCAQAAESQNPYESDVLGTLSDEDTDVQEGDSLAGDLDLPEENEVPEDVDSEDDDSLEDDLDLPDDSGLEDDDLSGKDDSQEEPETTDNESLPEDTEGEDSLDSDLDENGIDPVSQNSLNALDDDADPDTPPAQPVEVSVTISGFIISENKVYDGQKIICRSDNRSAVARISSGNGNTTKDEDVTGKVNFSYSITGTIDDGTPDGKPFSETDISVGMPKDVGSYRLLVEASGSDAQYIYKGSKEYLFQITKRPVTVKADDKQIKITDEKLPVYTCTATGFVGDDTFLTPPTLSCDTAELGAPGRYPISIQGAVVGPNYSINYLAGTLTIQGKEEASISGIDIKDKEYDGKPIDCAMPAVTGVDGKSLAYKFSIYGIKESGEEYRTDYIEVAAATDTTGDAAKEISEYMPKDAGVYKLKVTANDVKHKGSWQYDFRITRRKIVVKADDFNINKGAGLPRYTYQYDGFIEEDSASGDDSSQTDTADSKFITEPKLTCNITSTDIPGEYIITPYGAFAGANYTIEYQTGKLVVAEKQQITISGIEVADKIYDGEPIICKLTPEAAVDGESENADIEFKYTYSISGVMANGRSYLSTNIENDRPKYVGQYALQVTAIGVKKQGGNDGSDGAESGGAGQKEEELYRYSKEYSFRIVPRPIVIKPVDVELMTEDEMPQSYEYEVSGLGFLEGDDFEKKPVFICDIENTDEPGVYLITASGADAGDNYVITYQTATLTVVEREVEKTKELVRVIAPKPVTDVENATPLDKIVLPDTVMIKTKRIQPQENPTGNAAEEEMTNLVEVRWERRPIDGTSYSIGKKEEQTFKLNGVVQLPPDVDATGKEELLVVTIQVTVREEWTSRDKVAAPTASIASGTAVRRGTRITLSCATEGADIYYTLDGISPPNRWSNRYTYPIEVNGYTVIWAYAYKEGCPDSDAVKFSYFLSSTAAGGDDEDSEDSDVLEEDMPSDGRIPSGLWTNTLQDGYPYTGLAIKPTIRVYHHKTLLQEKKDYTIAYKNNVNAADKSSTKAPTITITGKGNYAGKLVRTFTISPKNISDPDVSVDNITVAYNKKAQKPVPIVLWNSKKLAGNKDYTVLGESYTDVGTRAYTVTGRGNYTGTRKFDFTITDGIPMSKVTVSKIPNQVYTGKPIIPQMVVKYKGIVLEENLNYTVEAPAEGYHKDPGTASVIIKGKGGRYVGEKRVTFKILPVASLAKAKVELKFTNTPVYTGKEIQADAENVTINVKDEDGKTVEKKLVRGTDYTVAYQNNTKAGTATAIFTGTGAYGGTIKRTFKITPHNMQDSNVRITLKSSYSYVKGGSRPEPQVTYDNKTLILGTDYTLSYKQNTAAGNLAVVTVKGKGNFGGSVDKSFTVMAQDIGELQVEAADKVYQNRGNIYKTTVRVSDTNGKLLSAGKDYDKNLVYTYEADVKGDNGVVLKKAGTPVEKEDIIPAGTPIRVTVTAKGNDYHGTTFGVFRITAAGISSAKVTVPEQIYTGKAIEPPKTAIRVVVNGTVLSESEYDIVGYSNNIKKGTAKMTIHGLGNYGGTKTVSFKIMSRNLSDL